MFKKSKSKTPPAEQEQKAKEQRLPFKARFTTYWEEARTEMTDFKRNSAKSFAKWLLVYVSFALFSLLLLNTDANLKFDEFPVILVLLLPRMFTLFLFTCPILILKKRKSAFVLLAAFWLLWHCIAFKRIKFGCAIFAILFLVSIFVYLAETPNLSEKYTSLFRRLTVFFFFTALAVMGLQMAQMKSLIKPFSSFLLSPDIFACNMLCFAGLGAFIFWVRRPKVAISCYSIIWTVLAVISYCKSRNTFEPVLFLDVFSFKEGLRAFFVYYSWFFIIGACVLIVLAVIGIVFLAMKEKKKPFSLIGMLSGILFFMIAFCGVYYMSNLNLMHSESKTAKSEYDTKGFVYSFLFYSLDSFVVEPEGYAPTVIETINQNIAENYIPYGTESNVQNVIVIQLESFGDPYDFPGIVLEQDPMPFMRSLINEYTSGYVEVPVFGGLTVKSEFEFLTGLSIENLPLGYNPYVQYVYENPMDSLARYFRGEGYETTAIHNYQGEFFQRHEVYKQLGFDYYIPYETMPDVVKIPSKIWGNDSVFVNHIEQSLDHNEDGRNFIFGVTVQMHGNYSPISEEEYPMKIGGIANKETEGAMAYYIQQLQEVDEMVKDLIAMLSEREEATYVLFYGDHLPSLFGESSQELSNEQKYATPYFTWNNMGIQKTQTEQKSDNTPRNIPDIELFQLSTFLCRELKIDGSYMNKFHTVYGDTKQSAQEFSAIQYYKMYDEKNDVDFDNPSYEIGLVPLAVTDIEPSEDSENSYVIKGTGFSQDTYLSLNNKMVYKLEFIDENTILLNDFPDAPAEGDLFTIRIIGEKLGEVLKESESYEWSSFIH
ncbi:MAG: LTA synthase family protein [Clostridia bacterium]